MSTFLRTAALFAFSRHRAHRWHQIAMVLAAAVASVALLAASALMTIGNTVSDHVEARHPVLADSKELEAAALTTTLPVEAGLGQVPVIWIEPRAGHENDAALVPPGLSRLPAPGTAVVSPGIVRHGLAAKDFGLRASTVGTGPGGTIGDDALASRSEAYVIARPPLGRHITADVMISGYHTMGDRYPWVETTLDMPTRQVAGWGGLVLLALPGVLVMIGAVRSFSPQRDRRIDGMWRQGVRVGRIRLLLAAENGVLAFLGAMVGGIAWLLVISGIRDLPLVDAELLPNGFRASWAAAVLVLVVVEVVTVLASVIGVDPDRDRQGLRRRHTVHRGRTRWPILLLTSGFVIMMLGSAVTFLISDAFASSLSVILLFVGGGLSLVALPSGVGGLVEIIGRRLENAGSPALWLACRRLRGSVRGLTRVGGIIGALMFLLGSGSALFLGTAQPPALELPDSSREVWMLRWQDPHPTDVTEVTRQLRARGMSVAAVGPDDPDEVTQPVVATAIGLTCEQFGQLTGAPTGMVRCDSSRATVKDAPVDAILGAGTGRHAADRVLVSAPRGNRDVDVLGAVDGLAAPNVTKVMGVQQYRHPGTDWFALGLGCAVLVGSVVILRELGDQAIMATWTERNLLPVGLTPTEAARTHLWSVTLPILVGVPVGAAGAVLFAMIGMGMGVTVYRLGMLLGIALGLVVVSLIGVLVASWWAQRASRP
ncbi:hypothetical protein O6R08_09220 [Cutibacterium equinum]|uniref:Efflux ABC transporter, permease protein n=1 Tax=Cutibacterium equinum TaxID=3016342 RepID=A0ABY7QX86_9ACTN|nr:hypothetical protein [Cutibacterium equinum]WCC79663.1 hypothetical protein O6R08_09220 [Cutibacterium equinum]